MTVRAARRAALALVCGLGCLTWSCLVPVASIVRVLAAAPPETAPPEAELTAADREHWSFRPLHRPELPAVRDAAWCRTPIDRFILARLEHRGLAPLPRADRATLLRRLSFDLTGLPPTPAEIAAYGADLADDATDRVIQRLLDSPAYGERWAQHWLDLVRFAETDGFEHDLERPHAWRYRDWVIDALNNDLPYDEFIRQQLAGDELYPDDAGAAIATGFLLCGPDMPDINLQDERRHQFLNDMTGTVGSVLLGLQLGCAQCHDHKYDPVSQHDFYRLRACFDPVHIFQDHPLPVGATTVAPPESPAQIRLRDVTARIEALEQSARDTLLAANPDRQPAREEFPAALSSADRAEYDQLLAVRAELQKSLTPPEVPLGRTVRERGVEVPASRYMIRGDFRRPGPVVEPAFPRVANPTGAAVTSSAPNGTSRRRAQLAEWITGPTHPLALRVIVNRIWQYHFGRGLVESSSDFGKMGNDPTHPELLDWLATEFPRQGWSLKRLHRLIVSSAVYQLASRPADVPGTDVDRDLATARWEAVRTRDPDNRWLARHSRQRLEGEAIRDALLAASGQLSCRRGGPGVRPPLPPEIAATLLANQWKISPDPVDHQRRSIYLFVRRNLRYPLFEAFDRPDANASCPRRTRSTIAPQALILLNSELSLAAARQLAGVLLAEAPADRPGQIAQAWLRTLGRLPTLDEATAAAQFLLVQANQLRAAARPADSLALPAPLPAEVDVYDAAALTQLSLALFNLNEFVFVD